MRSVSEDNGISILTYGDKRIYSVGISTGGRAEMRMAAADPNRRIIATTIDPAGFLFAKEQIEQAGLSNRIEVKIENISSPLPYPDGSFDYIYARLVLHYLPKLDLIQALGELYRILKIGGKMFVVVRSAECPVTRNRNSHYDPDNRMTTYTFQGTTYSRYFHSEDSIQQYLASSGFRIQYAKSYPERLCVDFERMQQASQEDTLIEVLAYK